MKLSREKLDIQIAKNCLTVSELAKNYGVSAQRIRMILNSKQVAPVTAGKLAKALGCDVTEILED